MFRKGWLMMRKLIPVCALAILCAVPAAAGGTGKPSGYGYGRGQACLEAGRIRSWKAPDDRTLIAENRDGQKFKIKILGFCQDLDLVRQTIAFHTYDGSLLTCIRPGDHIFFADGTMSNRCFVKNIALYTPEMEKADKAAKAAKEKGEEKEY